MMSDAQGIMKFEYLPNEILIECFEYLNAFDIFQAFYQLNTRFNNLICNTRLHIDFHHVKKSVYDQFLSKISSNPGLINQIYSIRVSNEDECFQCNLLLSSFGFDQFSRLEKFEVSLPSAAPPWYWETFQLQQYLKLGLTDVLFSKLQALSVICLDQSTIKTNTISSVTRFTSRYCSSKYFYYLIQYLPQLTYLNIKYRLVFPLNEIGILYNNQCAVHLKQLIIGDFKGEFESFEILVKATPNLRSLTISALDNVGMMDAPRWQRLIKSSLPYLNQFKFRFKCFLFKNQYDTLTDKFQQFQTDFWQEQHHWYTEYVKETECTSIYTIPYPSNTYELRQSDIRYSNNKINNINTFINVTDLKFYLGKLTVNCQYHFPYITSLTFRRCDREARLTLEHVDYLKKIVNLSNLKHLIITNITQAESASVLEIFKEAPHLSTITLDTPSLRSCLQNDDLCEYFSKMIKKLYQTDQSLVWYHVNINRFCEIFSNLEHLQCNIEYESDLLLLLNYLPQLSTLKAICGCDNDPKIEFSQFEEQAQRLNIVYNWQDKRDSHFYKYGLRMAYVQNKVFIWMNKNTI